MAAFLPQHLFWAFAAVQVAGLLSAALARFTENRSGQTSFQGLFFAAMSLVALVTVASIAMGWTAWVFSGATLSVMVVMAVWDSGLSTAS
jgi:hypothetical protein